ncbi:MarR family transcriptional regulator [Mycobacterium sp. CBMA293]|uniref:MarR family winged helix-turn-helix transcriptional regulator n=1 Tax=unclassified Mycolicibacterium TaxID=2636767 RepID=UPI0012DE10D0|nr:MULTISPECIES: MarR family transcriptional regulator [unclassified Mycolicibacterium]MUL44346.1 MarR family transcriptional regulator [Mycolicibacterium sp. CBMA 360]MUL59664.1 MarR family transcriptional regulator [Mycolicibacterium sp. CBMA 335]MUL68507.1 MarR family transcriptional regulator [Mycolicibacterium sp. CBMA 311]MUL97160.1 MarR family transcriptional regulator [Mycolicibacterium sp. CBMA 230]MUM06348.1 MarR family transcriptional regulator [Mycolicibacterium sp. CBMA 213]
MTGSRDELPAEYETAWRTWLRAHALLVRDLDAELRSTHGLTLLTYDALVQLSEAPGRRLRMKDLADALVYSTSGLTRIVDNLEREGYARRDTDPDNRRTIFVSLTDHGFRALTTAWPTHARGVSRHFVDHASATQARTMATVFQRIVADFEPPRS